MSKKQQAPTRRKVCSRCGSENARNARHCRTCRGSRFEPAWVKAKRPVNRQVSVQITASNPQYGKSQDRITLSKWWPGNYAVFHIPTPAQWQRIAEIIEHDLGPRLGWRTQKQLVNEARAKAASGAPTQRELRELATQHPDFLKKLVAAIDPKKLSGAEFDSLIETVGEVADAYSNANAGFREAFLAIIKKLPRQKQRALEDLSLLLKGWSLQVITNVAQQVRTRLQTIALFEQQVADERTFEIRGDDSIHRILERAMWMVDERYWLMYSNATLRRQIGTEMSKRDNKRYGKMRPDFVCGAVDNRLIILELKRPSHTLTVDDLNQLETYVTVADQYSNFRSHEAYLVGSKVDDELRRRMKFRSASFKILPYADLIGRTHKRYREFLNALIADT